MAEGHSPEDLADGVANGLDGSPGALAQPVLVFGEELLDRVQVGRIFGLEEQPDSGGPNAGRTALPLGELRLSEDDVAGLKVEPEPCQHIAGSTHGRSVVDKPRRSTR